MSSERVLYCTLKERCHGIDACKKNCPYLYDSNNYSAEHRWKGEGPPPPMWRAGGVVVYRSYADSVWD